MRKNGPDFGVPTRNLGSFGLAKLVWMSVQCFAILLLIMTVSTLRAEGLKFETVRLEGRVVWLADALKTRGLEADREPQAGQVVLESSDGTLVPLVSDEASRAFFRDERMRNRPVRIEARRYSGIPYVQVLSFRVEEEGKYQTPEYFCEVCAIAVRYPQICPCCQGPMILRMRPEGQ